MRVMRCAAAFLILFLPVLLVAQDLPVAGDPADMPGTLIKPQAVSLLGEPLRPAPPDQETLDNLAAARKAYAADRGNVDNVIWLGRRMAYAGEYRAAIAIYTRGIAQFPQDARLYRHRGHRYITLREFDRAIADLEHAVSLIEGTEDQIEPDGLPNALNIPVSSLHTNIWYHLGLAYYLKRDWQNALRAYNAGYAAGRNDDNRVSTTHWRYMILRRMGREAEAQAVLEPITPDMEVIENHVYHRLCLFYKGLIGMEEVAEAGADNPTNSAAAYGIANWTLYNGDEAAGLERMQAHLESASWAAFGYIAAESEVASRR